MTNGVIADKDACRFVPSPTGQTAKSSLMSFYWVDSVWNLAAQAVLMNNCKINSFRIRLLASQRLESTINWHLIDKTACAT